MGYLELSSIFISKIITETIIYKKIGPKIESFW
jgi:hypothetical protein